MMDNFLRFLKQNKQKGAAAILLTMLILGMVVLIGVAISSIFTEELRTSSFSSQTGPAYYAAESGAEFALYEIVKEGQDTGVILESAAKSLAGSGAQYWVSWDTNSILANGRHGKTRRKIEIGW